MRITNKALIKKANADLGGHTDIAHIFKARLEHKYDGGKVPHILFCCVWSVLWEACQLQHQGLWQEENKGSWKVRALWTDDLVEVEIFKKKA